MWVSLRELSHGSGPLHRFTLPVWNSIKDFLIRWLRCHKLPSFVLPEILKVNFSGDSALCGDCFLPGLEK